MNPIRNLFAPDKESRARRMSDSVLIKELRKADEKLQVEIEILQGCQEMLEHYGRGGPAIERVINYHADKGRKKRDWVHALEREAIRRGIGWDDLTEGRVSVS